MNEDERREFAEIARKIVYLANKARREGLLAIEEDLDTISVKSEKNTLFLKKLLSFVVDGVDNSVIRHIGETYISVAYPGPCLSRYALRDSLLCSMSCSGLPVSRCSIRHIRCVA